MGPLGLRDRGVFSRFDSQVSIRVPRRLGRSGSAIRIDKARRTLVLLHRGVSVKAYPVRFGFDPVGHKVRQGDGRTPEGRYTICEALHQSLQAKYGARSLRLSYPNIADARRGYARKQITAPSLRRIIAAVQAGRIPPQRTPLGGSLRIHGGGIRGDWTLGCVAMRDSDIIELYRHVGRGTPVEIRPRFSAKALGGDRDGDGIPDQVDVLLGARKLVHLRARYTGGYFRIPYPRGDVSSKIGVCSDVVIRALRNAGYDLQQLLHRHLRKNRRSYRWIRQPDRNIDHRRVKNLLVYFQARWTLVSTRITAANRHQLLPGDIVFLDTLPNSGPDHIGIVSDRMGDNGYPRIINNWTNGYHTSDMALLPAVPVTHHFRIAEK